MNLKKNYIYASIKCNKVCAIKANNTDKKLNEMESIGWKKGQKIKKYARIIVIVAVNKGWIYEYGEANGRWKGKLSKQQIGYGNKMNGIKVFFIVIRFYSPALFRAEMFIVSLVFVFVAHIRLRLCSSK